MNRQTFFIALFFVLTIRISNAQISFIGFEQEQCGIISDHGYTYENIPLMCGSHSSGYKIYKDGEMVFEKCIEFGGCSVLEIMFINETTGFIVESNSNGHSIYKTDNSGSDWFSIGGGAPTYLGFYLVNANTGYLITTWDSPMNLYINRVSDINQHYFADPYINQDITFNDTIFGESFCPIDTLGFKIKNSNDTIVYKLSFIISPLSVQHYSNTFEIQYYPNPCMDFVFFEGQENKNFGYKICDFSGKLIKTGIFQNNQIYVGDLKGGSYLMHLTNNDIKYSLKIIKK